MTVLGFWLTVAALCTALMATYNYVRNANRRRYVFAPARVWVKLTVAAVFAASATLLTLILRHDFSNGYVYSYSDRSLPLHFLMSTFYAGQEGSFLFWVLCSALIALMLRSYTASKKIESSVMAVYMGMFSFLLLLLVVKSPFKYVWEMFAGAPINQVPADGRGLNPLLQNFWMVLHPPVMFVGFAAMAVPYSFAVAALWQRDYHGWLVKAFPWVLFAVCSLGMGLILGAYWAYGVLGWGGYWGWDPVENSSLVPWITATALVHTMLVQRRAEKFVKTNFALAMVSFFLVVYSTFLTRSGILGDASVHSFSDPGTAVYGLLIVYLALILVLGFGMMVVRRRELTTRAGEVHWVNRETALGAGAVALVLSATVILFGTSLPIFSNSTVEPAFYDQTNLPIAIAMGLLIGLSLYAQWRADELRGIIVRAARSAAASVVLTGLLWFAGVKDTAMALFAFSAAFALIVNVEFALRTARVNRLAIGGKLAHLGLAVMFFGVIATGKYSTTEHLALPLNTPQSALGYTFTYTGYHPTQDGKYAFHVVAEKDGKTYQLAPLMFDAGQQGIMRTPDIASFLTKDIYVSPVSFDEGHHAAAAHETYTLPKGQVVSLGEVKAKFVKFDMNDHGGQAMLEGAQGMTIGSVLELTDGRTSEIIVPAMYYAPDGRQKYTPSRSKLINGEVQLIGMSVGSGNDPSTVTVTVHREASASTTAVETFVVEASIKPFVMLLWAGTVILTLGFGLAIITRAKET